MANNDPLRNKVNKSVRQGRLMPATVIDVFNDRASVRLGGNGQVLHNLAIVGGPIIPGGQVQVDFTTIEPTVVYKGVQGLTTEDLSDALKALSQQQLIQDTMIKITLFSGGAMINMYDPSPDGLELAVGSANVGDVVWLPDISIETDIVVPDGVTLSGISSRQSIIRGWVTLGEDSVLENLKVAYSTIGSTAVVGVSVVNTTAKSIIRNCEIHCYGCVSAQARGVDVSAGSEVNIENSLIVGYSAAAVAYAVRVNAGSIANIIDSRVYGTTSFYEGDGSVNEYGNVEGWEEATVWCNIPNDPEVFFTANDNYSGAMRSAFYSPKVPQVIGGTPTTDMIDQATDGYPSPISITTEYIYVQHYLTATNELWIREYKISNGTTKDVKVCNTTSQPARGSFTFVEGRKLIVTPAAVAYTNYVYLVDFEDSTSVVHYQWNDDTYTDAYTDYEYWSNTEAPITVRRSNGDLMVVVYGGYGKYRYNVETDDLYGNYGIYFLVKNWTQDGPWTMVNQEAILFSEDVLDSYAIIYQAPQVVRGRWVTIVPSYQAGYRTWNDGEIDPTTSFHPVVILDLDSLTSDSCYHKCTWDNDDSYHFTCGVNQSTGKFYFLLDGYLSRNGGTYTDVMEVDVETATMSILKDTVHIFYGRLFGGKNDCYYVAYGNPGFGDLYSVTDTVTPLMVDTAWFNTGYYGYDVEMDDNGKIWKYIYTTGHIEWLDPATETTGSFDSTIAKANTSPNRTYFFASNSLFIIHRNKYDTKVEWWVVKP